MNTDELKLVLDTIREVAGTAGTVGIVWVLIHYLVLLAQAVMVPMLTAWVCYRVFAAGFDAWKAPKVITREFKLDNLAIREDVAEDLKRALNRIRTTSYIHDSGVKKLNAALDLYEQQEGKAA